MLPADTYGMNIFLHALDFSEKSFVQEQTISLCLIPGSETFLLLTTLEISLLLHSNCLELILLTQSLLLHWFFMTKFAKPSGICRV